MRISAITENYKTMLEEAGYRPAGKVMREDVELDIPEPIMKQDLQKGQCCKCGNKVGYL